MSAAREPVRVVLAEDSSVARTLLTAILREDPGFQVVAAVADGEAAVRAVIKHRPSVVAMDLHMPGMDGAEATRLIMQAAPTPIVIVTASANLDGSLTYDALAAGALSVVPRPLGPTDRSYPSRRKDFLNELRLMSDVRVVRRIELPPRTGRPPVIPAMGRPAATRAPAEAVQAAARATGQARTAPGVIAIGASTGGPAALLAVLRALSPEVDVPVTIVQHVAAGFVGGLATWLSRETNRTVVVGENGMTLRPGLVVVAPDDRHLRVRTGGRIELGDDPQVSGHRPSASVLFESVADTYGQAAVGIILTGMGRDGADGLTRLGRAGGCVIIQSPTSSAVSGMPGAAIEAGAGGHVLDLADIPLFVDALVAGSRPRRIGRRTS